MHLNIKRRIIAPNLHGLTSPGGGLSAARTGFPCNKSTVTDIMYPKVFLIPNKDNWTPHARRGRHLCRLGISTPRSSIDIVFQ